MNRGTVLLLAVVGAGVDAVMLVAFGVLTAAQTGNTILLGVALGQGRWAAGLAAGTSVIGFVVGGGVGQLIIDGSRTGSGSPRIARALIVELLLLTLVLVGWWIVGPTPGPEGQEVLVALAAIAMGIQSSVTLRLHAGPTTTYVTGTLTTFTTGMIRWLRSPRDVTRRPAGQPEQPWMYGVTWGAYLAGAVVAALLSLQSPVAALLLPIGVLALAMLAAYLNRSASRANAAMSAEASRSASPGRPG